MTTTTSPEVKTFTGTVGELLDKAAKYNAMVHFEKGTRVTRMTRVHVDAAGNVHAGPDSKGAYTYIGYCGEEKR